MTTLLWFSSLKAFFQWALIGSSCAFIFVQIQRELPAIFLQRIAFGIIFFAVCINILLILINGTFIAMLTNISFGIGMITQITIASLIARIYLFFSLLANLQQFLPKPQKPLPTNSNTATSDTLPLKLPLSPGQEEDQKMKQTKHLKGLLSTNPVLKSQERQATPPK